jgi:hypothetical protein
MAVARIDKLHGLVAQYIKNDILKPIAKDYNLDLKELVNKYLTKSTESPSDVATTSTDPTADAPKKRGRKKKQKDEMLETEEYEWNGNKYLLDANNNVFTYDLENPKLVGEKLVDGTIRFLDD